MNIFCGTCKKRYKIFYMPGVLFIVANPSPQRSITTVAISVQPTCSVLGVKQILIPVRVLCLSYYLKHTSKYSTVPLPKLFFPFFCCCVIAFV